ncbi:Fc.00g061010.m01.CDS01 [Cosmosporella sp. VM-42]
MSRPSTFELPNSPSCRVLDRFSDVPDIEEDEWGRIPFWPLLSHLLQQPVIAPLQLIDLLQTISANASDDSGSSYADDYGSLKQFLSDEHIARQDLFSKTWPNIRDIALDLPIYFPTGNLDLLKPGCPLRLSRGQVACLVIHQLLCSPTPQRQDEGYQDFSIWYASEQRHPTAVQMYLTALFTYFAGLPDASALREDHHDARKDGKYITYTLHRKDGKVCLEEIKLGRVQVEYLDNHTTESHLPEVQGPKGAVVVSANKVIGFGQSATQEEIFVGIAPEACPAVLVAPHLTDETALTVSDARAMLTVTGQRRDIHWEVRPAPPIDRGFESWSTDWRGGNLIFMDALEMDMAEASEGLPDLRQENIDREINKAFTGFSSQDYNQVWTGLWGCGAFCGDTGVKLALLWIAASAASVQLNIMLGPEQHDIGRAFERVVKQYSDGSAAGLRSILLEVPRELRSLEILAWLVKRKS